MPNSGPNGEWFATTPEFWSKLRLPIVAFGIWYADATRVCGQLSEWSSAPVEGVQVLAVYHPDGVRTLVKGRDEYTLPGQQGSKLGLMIDLDEFHRIYRIAMSDPWRP